MAIYIVLTPAEMHTVYKHFHAEMLYTKTLKVMCVLAFMHTVCVCVCFQKIDALNIWSLIMVIGIRPKVMRVCLCVQMVVCERMNICLPVTTDSYEPTDRCQLHYQCAFAAVSS